LWQTLILSQWQDIFSYLPVESLIYTHQDDYYLALQQSTKPLTQYQSLPQTPHSAIAICKWMNKFKFIMKYRAKNECPLLSASMD
jgi:hypothetical protein